MAAADWLLIMTLYFYFLQANDYTVEIDSCAGLEGSLDTMALTLLSTHRATDRFATLKA